MRDISRITIAPSTTLLAALKAMVEQKVKTLFVFDDRHFEIFNEQEPDIRPKIEFPVVIMAWGKGTLQMEKVKSRGGRVGCFPVSELSWRDMGEWKEYLRMIKVL